MNFNVISIMADLVVDSLKQGVVGRSFADGQNTLSAINPREFTEDNHQAVDDRPFGGGDGMLMLAEPLSRSLQAIPEAHRGPVLYMSPQGKLWNDQLANTYCQQEHLTLICGRYGGVDQRFLNHYDIQEISIGDYVLSGGELAAAVIIDSLVRKIPGVLGHVDSAEVDSFADQGLLEAPAFTRPRQWQGVAVPELLLSGNHALLTEFRRHVGVLVTLQKRPELLQGKDIDWRQTEIFLQGLSDSDVAALGLERAKIDAKIKARF